VDYILSNDIACGASIPLCRSSINRAQNIAVRFGRRAGQMFLLQVTLRYRSLHALGDGVRRFGAGIAAANQHHEAREDDEFHGVPEVDVLAGGTDILGWSLTTA